MTLKRYSQDGLTLVVERVLDAPRPSVWRCWTEAELLRSWFCPHPWSVPEASLDPCPGGRMDIVMQGPEGERMENAGCFLEVVPGRRLVFTDSFTAGFVPQENPFMTGFVELADAPGGKTRLRWGARHATEAAMRQHLEMGFEQGWNSVVDQLEAFARNLPTAHGDSGLQRKVRTCLFLKDQAEEAARFYTSIVPDSTIDSLFRPDPDGPALVVEFTLAGAPCMGLNGNPQPMPSHLTSISVLTEDQAETDRLWAALTADDGEAGRCGWLKDRFGVHWQVVPKALPRLMGSGDPQAARRVSAALMTMQKIDIAGLEHAFAGKQVEEKV